MHSDPLGKKKKQRNVKRSRWTAILVVLLKIEQLSMCVIATKEEMDIKSPLNCNVNPLKKGHQVTNEQFGNLFLS